jgi:3-carboxy-cis,cis-muconate cycloisomerase
MGRHEAHQLLYDAAQRSQSEGLPYLAAIQQHPLFEKQQLPAGWADALAPEKYVGASAELALETVERVGRRIPT